MLSDDRFISFIDRCLEGSAAPEDVEVYVEYWHTHDTGRSLREYLGADVREYELWMKRGDGAISDIVRRRRERKAVKRLREESGVGISANAP